MKVTPTANGNEILAPTIKKGRTEMIEEILARTSLPNLHPAVVHFPIALLPMALLFDFASRISSTHRDWLGRGAAVLYTGAALGAGAAYWAGRRAADSLIDVPPPVQLHINHHSDWGLYSLWLVATLAVLRLALGWWDARGERTIFRVLSVAAGVVALAVLSYTADLGGGLVYRHAVAVASQDGHAGETEPPSAAASATADDPVADAGPPSQRLLRGEDGVVIWAPLPQDGTALGSLLQAAAGSSLDPVTWVEPGPDAQRGLALKVDGRALLVLSEPFGDVQVEAELELVDFAGSVGLAHHVRGARQAGLFTLVAPGGTFALRTLQDDDTKTLGEESHDLPAGPLRLAVSAAGRHLRGMLDGAMVVHGHEPALPDGACGIFLDGRGEIRIVSLRIAPLSH